MTDDNGGRTKKSRQKLKEKPALNFMLISSGSIFTSMIISGFLVGYALDTAMMYFFDIKTMPIFLLSCGLLGFIGGTKNVQKLLSKMDLLETTQKNSADRTIEAEKKENTNA